MVSTIAVISAVPSSNLLGLSLLTSILGIDQLYSLIKSCLSSNSLYVALFMLFIILLNYLYFTSDGLYRKIIKRYGKEPIAQRKKVLR